MAAPTVITRGTPAGFRMDDGFKTLIAFENDPTLEIWEKTVQPPGLDCGDPIQTSTMHNTLWRTKSQRALIEVTDANMTVAYDPDAYETIMAAAVNIPQSITVRFPNGMTYSFWGYMRSFEPQDHQEGEQPEANIVIVVTNYDPVNCVEAGPVLTGTSACLGTEIFSP